MKDRFWFVYMAHGGWQFRKQAILSIFSLVEKGPVPGKILVYTDRPEEFENLPAEPVLLDKSRIKRWRGPYGYTHRMKMGLLRDLFGEAEGHVVFVDSDTFWTDGSIKVCEFLHDGCAVMHDREGVLSEGFFPQYLAALRKTEILKKEGIPVSAPKPVWIFNSGILGLPSTMNPDLLEETLRLCDFLCRDVPFTMEWVEQVAFSYIFQNRGIKIKTCAADLLHYWRDSFEFSRWIRKCSQEELIGLGKSTERVSQLIEEGRTRKRSFWNQLLLRAKRLERSARKRKRESLVLLERLKFKILGMDSPEGRH
jgi:hypothetical protein